MIRRILFVSLSATLALALCSCGKPDIRKSDALSLRGEPSPARRPDSVLARNEGIPAEPAVGAELQAREPDFDQELLARAAIQVELDRDAQVAQAIERARQKILAQAYIDRAANAVSQPSRREIRNFYDENPALFGKRRTYRVFELMVDLPEGQFGALQEAVAQATEIAGVVRWLDTRMIPFHAATSSATAERIPASTLRQIFWMRKGQLAVFQTAWGASVIRLDGSVEAPLTEKEARPAIARYLLNRSRLELAQAEITKLRERAKIDGEGQKRARPATMAQAVTPAAPFLEGPRVAGSTSAVAGLK